ncbi:MAG: chitobiase/beta-hexosaminidase C-terminal domain-containing protein [Acidobacteriaceae bacterium]|nr:chitobiase/beta-hexosaminidase C-terminal domain-containing protein [Acidobacteriaceae bacterium]
MSWFSAKAFAQIAPVADRAASSDNSAIAEEISAPGLHIGLSRQGHILEAKLGPEQVPVPLRMCTNLQNCTPEPGGSHRKLEGGGAEFIRRWTRPGTGERCRVTERLVPTATSIRWEIEVLGEGEPWSTGIETQLAWLDGRGARLWTAWSQPAENLTHWADPLTFAGFSNRTLKYGTGFAVPMVTAGNPARNLALSVVQSPEDMLLDMDLKTTELGDAILTRFNHRISKTTPVRFAVDLVAHPADWRAGLGWMTSRYPRFFEPENPHAYELDGCGAYSGYHGKLDVQALADMGYSALWNASFDWPYEGIHIPLVDENVEWTSWYQKKTTIAQMREFAKQTKAQGFNLFQYFNINEAGNFVQDTAPPRKAIHDADLWRDPNDFVHYQMSDAVLRDEKGKITHAGWFDNVALDPGEPVWRDYLLKMAEHMVAMLPESDGICIDRLDWLTAYNTYRDDGVTWKDGKPARSFVVTWNQTLARLAPIFHQAGKYVFANCITRRVDVFEHTDGFFTEFGDSPDVLNVVGVIGSQCPVTVWTYNIDSLRPDPDAFFQQRLHLGVFPMVPYPDADHSIAPDPWVDAQYLDYGRMLNAIRGKRWVLRANAVSCAGEKAKVNLFDIPGGLALPITFGSEDSVDVSFEAPPEVSANHCVVQALYLGEKEWSTLDKPVASGKRLQLRIPLKRGCALVRAVYVWIDPEVAAFKSSGEMGIHCTLPDAVIRYTLDGSDPGMNSATYNGPIKVNETAKLKAAIFVSGKQVGRTLFRQIHMV